jgi:hypothetical protein
VSRALIDELAALPHVEQEGDLRPLTF